MRILNQKLLNNHSMILDGGMATELEKLGVQTNTRLWSAIALVNHPEKIYEVHKMYLEAGANIITTNTYQANIQAFEEMGISCYDAENLVSKAVEIAKQARNDILPNGFVAGSVGPYGAYLADGSEYTGDYKLSENEFKEFHRARLQLLISGGVDVIALETMPNFSEVKSLVSELIEISPDIPYWVSFSLRDGKTLCDGTSLIEATKWVAKQKNVLAIGLNCVTTSIITQAISHLKQASRIPIIVYPNSGEKYDPNTKAWEETDKKMNFIKYSKEYLENGVKIIGGCCGTTPNDIKSISDSSFFRMPSKRSL